MSTQHPTPQASSVGPLEDQGQVAHELSNLLDASMRNVGLVLRSLQDATAAAEESRIDGSVIDRLDTASQAMNQMGTLLHRWLAERRHPIESQTHTDAPNPNAAAPVAQLDPAAMVADPTPIPEMIDRVLKMLEPQSRACAIDIFVHVADEARATPAGLLQPVIHNTLSNAIESLSRTGGGVIDLNVQTVDDRWLEVAVIDDGPGLDPRLLDDQCRFRFGLTTKETGHGIGLQLCRDIAKRVGGEITLSNHAPWGAAVKFRLPLRAERE